ncbi:Z1 domain-containing protein [Aromatoleum evansii]|uniref:Z1 domain-containing protein n=1 Tax=Aromatoleum evansii TaxID=59406 RepID=UPI00145C75AE|nr:Z1 domain-containing protein [Aromatoleum evansii]NMG27970.1 endonuclease [Aromatoleum evansii]
MADTSSDNTQRVIKFVQELLLDEEDRSSITPALIAEKIDMVVAMKRSWGEGLDRDAVTDELIRRFSVWIGQDTTLSNDVGHIPWLTVDRKRDWRYWQRYRDWLEGKLSWKAVDALDQSTDTVLGFLEDPQRTDPWDRRGLVVGHVQSGKTGSYTGLICKAADAGYKIIIVLAGLHNNLRSQTQIRLDEGFLGFATNPNPEVVEYIGAGADGRDAAIRPNCATTRADNGDFNTKVAKHLAITPEQRPWLFVVKKNKTVLTRLLHWIRNHAANTHDPETGRKIVTHLPLLIIDDEADHASVDTGEQMFDENGMPDEEHQPKAINSLIRQILHAFSRSAYVGYTATPFANIFIHERGITREEGPDIFPAAFIVNLAAPSNYVGPTRVFGLTSADGRTGGLPLVREVTDHATPDGRSGWMPQGHKNGHRPRHDSPEKIPSSLVEAIDCFLITCAVRRLRGQAREHASMLIHVTRFNNVQQAVLEQVDGHLSHLRQRICRNIDADHILGRLQALWERDFVPTSSQIPDSPPLPAWGDVAAQLADAVSEIDVRMINGTAKDALDYAEHNATGLKVIAIGGDKLARGLTLEGLCVSYFLRASKMYDTLMQMGRWFGYRPGYLDLCRLYTTDELIEWFGHIADASEELREEFDLMAASGATPRDYGLKVQSHPVLMVTSRLKMRAARNLLLSFSGQVLETVSLYREASRLEANLRATRRLVEAMGGPTEPNPKRSRGERIDSWTGFLWNDVPATTIIDFLGSYQTHPAAYKVNSAMLAEFVGSMARIGELTKWTVMVMGSGSGAEKELAPGYRIRMNKRTGDKAVADRYSIGRLLDPKDEAIDLGQSEWEAALALTRAARKPDPARLQEQKLPELPNGPSIRRIRGFGAEGVAAHPERGVLLIYTLDPKESELGLDEDTPPIVAFGISFPGSDSGVKIEYKVNNVLWEQEYGPAE